MSEESKEAKKPATEKTGWVDVEFLKDFGSYKKGETKTYHKSTVEAAGFVKDKVAKIVKEHTKYVPEQAEK